MKTKTLVLTTIFFLLSVSARAIEEVKRTISKEFSVSADDEIIVINKYGNLTISFCIQKLMGKKQSLFYR